VSITDSTNSHDIAISGYRSADMSAQMISISSSELDPTTAFRRLTASEGRLDHYVSLSAQEYRTLRRWTELELSELQDAQEGISTVLDGFDDMMERTTNWSNFRESLNQLWRARGQLSPMAVTAIALALTISKPLHAEDLTAQLAEIIKGLMKDIEMGSLDESKLQLYCDSFDEAGFDTLAPLHGAGELYSPDEE